MSDDYANYQCGTLCSFRMPSFYPKLTMWQQHCPHPIFSHVNSWPEPEVGNGSGYRGFARFTKVVRGKIGALVTES